jgi:hypothetical protein
MAALQGYTSVVTLLLDAKADVNLGTIVRYSSVAITKSYYFNVNVIRLPSEGYYFTRWQNCLAALLVTAKENFASIVVTVLYSCSQFCCGNQNSCNLHTCILRLDAFDVIK